MGRSFSESQLRTNPQQVNYNYTVCRSCRSAATHSPPPYHRSKHVSHFADALRRVLAVKSYFVSWIKEAEKALTRHVIFTKVCWIDFFFNQYDFSLKDGTEKSGIYSSSRLPPYYLFFSSFSSPTSSCISFSLTPFSHHYFHRFFLFGYTRTPP